MKTVTQTAELFGVTRKTIINWIDKGLLKATKPSGVYYIEESEIDRLRMIKHPKRTYIKEEFVKLTGNYKSAIVLDKMMEMYAVKSSYCDNPTIEVSSDMINKETMLDTTEDEMAIILGSFVANKFAEFKCWSNDEEEIPTYTVDIDLIESKIQQIISGKEDN